MTDITDKLTEFLGAGNVMFVCKKGHSWADHKEEFPDTSKVVVVHQNTVSNDGHEHCTVCGDLLG